MDVGRPVSRAHAHCLPVSLETVTLATGEQTCGARRRSPPPAGGGRQQDVLRSHDGGATHLCGQRVGGDQEMNLEKYLLTKTVS